MVINNKMETYDEFIRDNPEIKTLDPNGLPDDLTISTMTCICRLPVIFNVINIARHLPLSSGFIQTIKCGNSGEIYRSLFLKKIKPRKKIAKKYKNMNFYNQVTIVVNTTEHKMNFKLFRNGSMQITGCKKISVMIWMMKILLEKLSGHIYSSSVDGDKIIVRSYANPDWLSDIQCVTHLRIVMINSNFNIGFRMDREKVFRTLIEDKYDCSYDPSRHAGVKLKYTPKGDDMAVSIFIFDKGSIIITGGRNYRQIGESYKFINEYLIKNCSLIVVVD